MDEKKKNALNVLTVYIHLSNARMAIESAFPFLRRAIEIMTENHELFDDGTATKIDAHAKIVLNSYVRIKEIMEELYESIDSKE